jgi:hypothetical protein
MERHLDTPSKPSNNRPRVVILHSGDREAKFQPLASALEDLGAQAQSFVYRDELARDVRPRLAKAHAVLVWVNPIEDGRDRSMLDAMLREASASGTFVSAHPDVILQLGTKEVLYRTRDIGWGCDTHLYRTLDDMRRELPARLVRGETRVLKQYRGNGGIGVWKVEQAGEAAVRVRHAKRGCAEETLALEEFLERCQPYFAGEGRMIDQAWQPRLPEGMVRCYLVHDRVEGFGHQALVALHPTEPPGPRLYHPASMPEFQALKDRLEREWVPALQRLLGIEAEKLPVLWDCDFLLGPKDEAGRDTYVLCEINVSCVSPFPDSALIPVARAALARAKEAMQRH